MTKRNGTNERCELYMFIYIHILLTCINFDTHTIDSYIPILFFSQKTHRWLTCIYIYLRWQRPCFTEVLYFTFFLLPLFSVVVFPTGVHLKITPMRVRNPLENCRHSYLLVPHNKSHCSSNSIFPLHYSKWSKLWNWKYICMKNLHSFPNADCLSSKWSRFLSPSRWEYRECTVVTEYS